MLLDVVVAAGTSAGASALAMWLFKELLSTRLKAAIQHEYATQLETFKANIQHEYATKLETSKAQLKTEQDLAILSIQTALSREASFQAAAHAGFAEGQKAAMERRLSAVDRLWSCLLKFRATLPPVLMF